MAVFALAALLVFGGANFVFSVLILRTLSAADVRVSFFELRWQVHRHLKTYRDITRQDGGRVGFSFYGYWGSLLGLIASTLFFVLSLPG